MKITIVTIHEKGKQDAEYVELKVLEDCNLMHYMLCDTTFQSESKISNKLRHMHWFAPKAVKKGDFIFLRTGTGTNREFANKAGTTTHEFFWGLKEPIWNNTGDAGVLFELENWETKKA
jgi:hypothetical protein